MISPRLLVRSAGPLRRFRARFFPALELLETRNLLSTGHFQPQVAVFHPAGRPADSPTPWDSAYAPSDIKTLYGIDQVPADGTGETIAIVDAYDDPKFVSSSAPNFASSDLHQFDLQYGLPEPAGFFTKVDQNGGTNYPAVDPAGATAASNWEYEIALDVEWAHAIAPGAKIMLVEAQDDQDANTTPHLFSAVGWAGGQSGAVAVSMSWGDYEWSGELADDASAFVEPSNYGVTYFAATGDMGAPSLYPAYSPRVVAVGGTTLNTDPNTGAYVSEDGWTDQMAIYGISTGSSGGGLSTYESQPSYQSSLTQYSGHRANPDVSFNADQLTGVSVYDSYNGPATGGNWFQEGGTSLASPCWAGLVAIADQLRAAKGLSSLNGPTQTLPLLYRLPASDFHDEVTGNNGQYSCAPGYDLVTGIGSPVANKLVPDLANQGNPQVISSTPANGATLATAPTSFTVTFSDPINPSTLQASALQVNGLSASTASVDSTGTIVTFTYSSSPVTAQGPQTMSMAANVVDAQGTTNVGNSAFSATFYYDTLTLALTSTSPGPGGVFHLPASSFTFDLTFNKPIDTSKVNVSNLTLSQGTVSAAAVMPGNQTAAYTLTGLTTEGILTISFPSGIFKDSNGDPASPTFSGTYYVDNGIVALPPLTSVAPLGSMVYGTSASSLILYPGDRDQFTLAADPGQTLTVAVTPTSSTLAPTIQLSDPAGAALGSTTASLAGQSALLETVTTTTSGTYTLNVGGHGLTTGGYTVQVYLDGAVEPASVGIGSDSTRGTAQNLNSSFVSLQTSVAAASRATVVGSVAQPITLNASSAGQWDSTGSHSASSSSYEVGQIPPTQYRDFFVFDLSSLNLPVATATLNLTDVTGGYSSPLSSDTFGLFGVATPVAALMASGTGQAGIFTALGSGVSYGSRTITSANDGTTIATPLNAAGLSALTNGEGRLFAIGGALTSITGSNTQYLFGSSGNATDTMQLVLTLADTRYYAFTLAAGEEASIGLKYLTGGGDQLTLQNAGGDVLATGAAGGGFDSAISKFTAPAAGTYYVVVSGSSAATYSLNLTRDAALDAKTNATFGTAQDLSGTTGVSGALSSTAPDWYKVTLGSAQNALALATKTPLSGPGQPLNSLKPILQLFNASDTLVASGTTLADGRNQSLSATGLSPGATYYIEVSSSGSTQGEYFLGVAVQPAAPVFSKFLVSPQVSPATIAAGNAFLVQVQAADQFGNPITSGYSGPSTVTLSLNPATTESTFPSTVSIGSNGLGVALGRVDLVGSFTITAAAGGFSGASSPLTVTPGPAARLGFATQPASTPTGVGLPTVSVQLLDLYGNVVSSDNTHQVTLGIASGPGVFTSGSTTVATFQNGVASFKNLTLVTPGTYQLSVSVPGLYTGPNSVSFTVAPLQVAPGSLAGAPWGFSVQFNAPLLINSTTPVLYGLGFGPNAPVPSVIVTTDPGNLKDTAAIVAGSLVLNTATNTLTFVATDTGLLANDSTPILPDGTYTVILHGSPAGNGFQALNAGGGFLDGKGNGTPGSGDYTGTFTVSAAAAKDEVVWVPATADGPGQALNAPGMNQAGGGFPIYLDDNSGSVTSVQLTLNYNSALLTVSGVTGPGFTMVSSSPGQVTVQYSGPALATGVQTPIGFLTATVPSGSAGSPMPYKAKDLLHLSGVTVNGSSSNIATADALHLVAYVGDADANGGYSSNDAVLITHVSLQQDSGFTAYPTVDPVIVADTDGFGFIGADAASQVNEAGVGFPTATLPNPPIPSGVVFTPVTSTFNPQVRVASHQVLVTANTAPVPTVPSNSPVTTKITPPLTHPGLNPSNLYAPLAFRHHRSALDPFFALIADGGEW